MKVKDLAESYLNCAFSLCNNNEDISMDSFYENLRKEISRKFGVEESILTYIDHPFHWFLFLDEESPFEIYQQSKGVNGKTLVRIKSKELTKDIKTEEQVEKFLKKYEGLLERKIERHLYNLS
ncbi:MAG: hypothetical protein KatS3mg001_358 [Candidatus Pacearchaeota archaeon]|nr:MAG: hypothetical protein KatS3mg001_358 [Candidatus Pacearchaeota archaeon]